MSTIKGRRVLVGMSGGVDSSVAAYLLKQATPNSFSKLFGRPTPKGFRGYEVTGVFLRSYNLDGCAERDAEDARRVAEQIGIPFYVWDCEEEYKKKVVDYMVRGYAKGETPNPDVMCNKEIKFGLFYDEAMAMGADYIATGHYVRLCDAKLRIHPNDANHSRHSHAFASSSHHLSLFEAKDKNKDQSYFLWTLTQEQLAHCLFPIGEYKKPEVREIARKAELPTAEKKDSQGICFLGMVSIEDFLKTYIKPKRGEVVTIDGRRIGEHDGAAFYTIGQRHGLNLGAKNRELGIKGAVATKPYYIAEKDIATNTVVVAEGDDNPALFREEVELTDVNFIDPNIFEKAATNAFAKAKTWASPRRLPGQRRWGLPVMARVRYRQPLAPAILSLAFGRWSLKFDRPVKFAARGQSAVFYSKEGPSSAKASDGREVLGGGVISSS